MAMNPHVPNGDSGELPELTKEETLRYSRHLIVPEVGMDGQRKLKHARVLLIGGGGLGCPLAQYLAAAGVGTLGLVEFDKVDLTNLQRQILYSTEDVGRPKLDVAAERIHGINPNVDLVPHNTRLSSANALEIFEQYDVIVDGTDNFPTRYLVNDASVLLKKPNVYGSIFRFEGQATVFDSTKGPCYRCLYPEPPPPGLVPSCAEGGVLGVLPGLIGMIQAIETIKLILGKGSSLVGRLVLFDALDLKFREVKLRKNPECPICGPNPTIHGLIDYEEFCGIRGEESHTQVGLDDVPSITVEQLQERIDRGEDFEILDVRNPEEWEICRLDTAKLIPLPELASRMHELDSSREYVVHCKLGGRSAQAIQFLQQAGFTKLHNLTGGIDAWAEKIDPSMPRY